MPRANPKSPYRFQLYSIEVELRGPETEKVLQDFSYFLEPRDRPEGEPIYKVRRESRATTATLISSDGPLSHELAVGKIRSGAAAQRRGEDHPGGLARERHGALAQEIWN